MMEPWNAPFSPPRPQYVIGFELVSGRVIPAAEADSLAWGQALLVQVAATTRAAGGAGVLVLLHVATGHVRERITITPGGPPVT